MRRRSVLALPLLALPAAARAQDWRAGVKELRFGISSAENERDAIARFEPLSAYIQATLGVPMRVFRSTDYAGVVEGLNARHLDAASMGPANYALANKVMGPRIAPFARSLDAEGGDGYFSVVFVKADSPFRTLDDLKGRSFAFADPNSASGYAFPNYHLKKAGYDPAKHFSRTGFSGSHEMSVIAVLNGTFDAAPTFWTSEARGNIQRMVEKRMIPEGAVRIIWKSPRIPGSPWVIRTELPEALRREFAAAIMAMPQADPEGWAQISSRAQGLVAARHEDYLDVIEVVRANDAERRRTRS